MLLLTIVCDRCSKETVIDLTGSSSLDLNGQLRKEGFQNINANKKSMLICTGCANKYKELVDMHQERAYKEVCEFFNDCKGKDNDGNNHGAKND